MTQCPVCDEDIENQEVLQAHIASHFTTDLPIRPIDAPDTTTESAAGSLEGCLVCGYPLTGLSEGEKQVHVNGCLDGPRQRNVALTQPQRYANTRTVWDGPSRPRVQHEWAPSKLKKGDDWWNPLVPVDGDGDSIPSNFSPSVGFILQDLLAKSSLTARAVLSLPTTHIRYSFGFDTTWGCGYRNALMAISGLVINCPEYRPVFSREAQRSDPGVRRVQAWIEQAWADGYDPLGRAQLKGKVVGTRKWIGTTELYAMFSFMGVGCKLYDFPKPEKESKAEAGAHVAVQRWVKAYFQGDVDQDMSLFAVKRARTSNHDATMRSTSDGIERGERVRKSARLPLILQHSGHSRTIVGYEEMRSGAINLIIFDPARTVPKSARAAGIRYTYDHPVLVNDEAGGLRPSKRSRPDSGGYGYTYDAPLFRRPYMNGNWNTVDTPDDAHTMRDGSVLVAEDEVMDAKGWVRKKVSKIRKALSRRNNSDNEGMSKVLGPFRVNLSALSRNTQYQILAFDGGPVLSQAERAKRKDVSSTVIR